MPRLLTFVRNIQPTLGSHFVHGIYQLYTQEVMGISYIIQSSSGA